MKDLTRKVMFQMHLNYKKLFLLSLCLMFVMTLVRPAHALQTVDRILVVVNNEIITESDLDAVLEPIVARMKATIAGEELEDKIIEARGFFLKKLVEERLVISAAKDMKIEVEEKEIDEMVDDLRKKFPTEDAFQETLRQQGLSSKKIRDRFKNDIMKRKITDFKVRGRISISPGEVREYYNEHSDEFRGKPEVRVRQILIRAGDTRPEEDAKVVAASILEKLQQGGDMEALAREFSEGSEADQGGDMGWVKQGQFMDRIDRALFVLKNGELTKLIKTQLGYHIFKIEDMKESEPLEFDDVLSKVEGRLYKEKSNKLMMEWLGELRENAYIAYQD